MKKLTLGLLLGIACIISLQAQDRVFYYNELGEKIYLKRDSTVKFIHFANETAVQNNRLLNQLESQNIKMDILSPLMYKISGDFSPKLTSKLFTEQKDSNIAYISDMLLYKGSTVLWESDKIIVKISPNTKLLEVLEANHIPYKEWKRLGSNPQTYLVTLDISEQNAIDYANRLVENKSVVIAQPSFWRSMQVLDNPYFSSQWGLQNTEQYDGIAGVDIKATHAWNIADGSGIKLAVIDDGVDLTHPDIWENLLPGYDATDGKDKLIGINNTYGGYGGFNNNDSHGTACAGIIAARDNEIGIKGIAYNAKIIPIRVCYGLNPYSGGGYEFKDEWIVSAIKWAWESSGADILSCSWHIDPPSFAVSDEIERAAISGRGGKGCVLVFSAGNNNKPTINYPANLPNVIAVGAISPCGTRKRSSHISGLGGSGRNQPDPAGVSCDGEGGWGSNYGEALDIMAPGTLIPTTDIQGNIGFNPDMPIHLIYGGNKITSDVPDQDYTVWFGGTSAATPHVAGVAALILSVKPDLTQQQVRNILQSTAQKISPDLYGYEQKYIPGHSYSLFHPEVGYGLVDAYAAVHAATCIEPVDLMVGDTPDDAGMEPNPSPDENIVNSPNIWVRHKNFPGTNINAVHQYAVPNEINYIFVRVRNTGCQSYGGGAKLSLYWAKEGTDLNLPESWNHIITDFISPIAANGEGIEEFPWMAVPDPGDYEDDFEHSYRFYLMAKIEWANDPLAFPGTMIIEDDIRNNNNIACRGIEIGSGIDLMIKDNAADIGVEPNETTDIFCKSPDIWVRNDPIYDEEHQNPIGNDMNYVYVRIKNNGRNASQGNEKLYLSWSKGGTNLAWPECWNGEETFSNGAIMGEQFAGEVIPTIPAGGEHTMKIVWYTAPSPHDYSGISLGMDLDRWHFCLLARISSDDSDPITFPETVDLNRNVKENNNIALKNVSIIKVRKSGSAGAIVSAGNNYDWTHPFCLKFTAGDDVSVGLIQDAEVTVRLDDILYNAWIRGGAIREGIEEREGKTFLITGGNANLCNLLFEPHEFGLLDMQFNFPVESSTIEQNYTFHVIQTDYETGNIIGGEVYSIIKSAGTRFQADAGEDVYADVGETVTFHAVEVDEPASYNWYKQDGGFIHEGRDLAVVVTQTEKYTLEVAALEYDYKSYAEVWVRLKPSRIETIFPNPAIDEITVTYKLNNVNNAFISLSHLHYPDMHYVYDVDVTSQSMIFDLHNYPIGAYVITLVCDGEPVSSHTFIKH